MSTEANKEFGLKLIDAISNNDGAFLKNAFTDDLKFWVAGSIPVLSGTHSTEFLMRLGKANPKSFPNGLKLTAKGVTAEGDRVAIEAESLGAHSSGKTYNNFYHILLEFRDGKVAVWKEYMDTSHAHDVLISDGAIHNYD